MDIIRDLLNWNMQLTHGHLGLPVLADQEVKKEVILVLRIINFDYPKKLRLLLSILLRDLLVLLCLLQTGNFGGLASTTAR